MEIFIFTSLSYFTSSDKKEGYDWHITEFESSLPMSTYLVALVVSDFKCKNGIAKSSNNHSVNVSVCARPNAYDDLYLAYNSSIKLLEFFENYYNKTYPLKKLSMLN